MPLMRKTAVVQFELGSGAMEGSLPLATERAFNVILVVEGRTVPAQSFRSPVNDEQWRDYMRRLRECNVEHDDSGDAGARAIKALTRKLYMALSALAPELRAFLERGDARRLVIQTTRPELHLLPWAAMFDDAGKAVAANDLSVVHTWRDFSEVSQAIPGRLRLLKVLGVDTSRVTAEALNALPPEIEMIDALAAFRSGREVEAIDILHLEEHGDVALGLVGGVRSSRLAHTFQSAKMALLWSCHSGATDSWGESPALCLHRDGVGMVLSFVAELHNQDAKSISKAFYADVFGAAASRDPETALLRIRAAKLKDEFYAANWASMTVYLRAPVDMSALALNGPRVPAAGWTSEAVAGALSTDVVEVAASWGDAAATVTKLVRGLQPGSVNSLQLDAQTIGVLPREAFAGWRGTVIRLDGAREPLADGTLSELNLAVERAPQTDGSDRLVWFFGQIARYGSPLIVWTHAAPRHAEFLKAIKVSSALTFLLLYASGAKDESLSVAELVDHNRLQEARALAAQLPTETTDGELSAAYFAYARAKMEADAEACIARLKSAAERMLLSANFVSRFKRLPKLAPEQMLELSPDWTSEAPRHEYTPLERQRLREDLYRGVMSAPGAEAPRRESGRAKHELAYLLQTQGKTGAAETLHRLALEDLEHSPKHGIRWHGALGAVLRDWADLLADDGERLDEAQALLARAMAVHAFHGRRLEVAYSLTTAARIALAGCHHTETLDRAVDAANLFEECGNRNGWAEAVSVMFDSLAETRETARMLALADMATAKAPELERSMGYQRARAHWIAGSLDEARRELAELVAEPPREAAEAVARLSKFLG